jgi:hypothetical protein
MSSRQIQKPDFSSLADKWPSTFVAREKIGEFSGGILSSGYCANLDSLNKGIEGRVRVGRKIAYPAQAVVRFLENRAEVL